MKRSLFDKIFLGFLFLSVAVFAILIFYSTNVTKNSLISEKIDVLTNEAFLISDQTISRYIQGYYTIEDTKNNLEYYSNTLNASIWLIDDRGMVVACSNTEAINVDIKNIYLVYQDFDITTSQTFTGNFYGVFKSDVITVAIPIISDNVQSGMLLIHSTLSQLDSIQSDIFTAIYVPFLILLVISLCVLALISGKIIKPIKRINSVAQEYSLGNFDTKCNIRSRDEIGQLANTLEYMATELSKLEDYRRDFISNISHDFRSPLTSIKGYIEAILDGTIPPEKQAKYLNVVLKETHRLTKLTTNMLEINSLDNHGHWITPSDFDIVEHVKQAINTFEGKCNDKGISLILNNHTKTSIVTADKSKIQQVIYNLLDNAIKFTPAEKSIYVTLTENNDIISISIKDEGIGIPQEDLKKIWIRFYKTDTSRGKDKQGTGLGLSIVKEIIKAHNQHINVVSTPGVGSEFTFSLSKADSSENDTEN